jgi:hypothetical protein
MCYDCKGVAARVLAIALGREISDRHERQPQVRPEATADNNVNASRCIVDLLTEGGNSTIIFDDRKWNALIAERVAKLDDGSLTIARKVTFWESAVLTDILMAVRTEMAKRAAAGSAECAYGVHEANDDDMQFVTALNQAFAPATPNLPTAKPGAMVS